MAKQNWKSIDLMDVIGMASNPVNPGTKFAKRLLNVYAHEKPGALTLRPGYAPKYTAPSDSTITSSEFINFGVFFDRQADLEGQEIICEIQKGIVTALRDDLDQPIVANTFQGLQFWVRPYWDGAQWLNNWQWVNKTIITKITDEDAAYPSKIKIYGNLSHGLGNDSLIGWTIYNLTKNQYARIITCKIESPGLWLNVSLYDNVWEFDDVIICSRCWIDIDAQLEFFNNVEKEDIVFHRINHDLRIGFGGKENRPSLMIGYRKSYLLLKEIDFTNKHLDILETGALEKYSKTDGVILDTAILNDQYGIEIATQTGSLEANTYYFRLTGIIDNYQEQLVAEANIVVDGAQDILVSPYIQSGTDNFNVTKLKLYLSTDNITFNKIGEYSFRANTSEQTKTIVLRESGRLEINQISMGGEGDYHQDSNAANITNEANSVGQWLNKGDEELQLFSVTQFEFFSGTVTPNDGSYFLIYWDNGTTWHNNNHRDTKFKSPLITSSRILIHIEFDLFLTATSTIRISSEPTLPNPFVEEDYLDITHNASPFWQHYSLDIEINGSITFEKLGLFGQYPIGVDGLTATNPNTGEIVYGTEMNDEMGYTPTFNMVKGWDFVVVKDGRVYYFNPYVEKRYDNFTLVSAIAPPATFMWDIASFANFRELEKYDSNETIGAELLPNKEILILKDASVTTLIDDGRVGITREPVYGVDCISRVSIVNINGLIFWCGKEEIYLLNAGRSLVPQPLLKDTIRDLYLAIEDKSKIFGTRNRFNTYRIRIDDAEQKIEYLFTEDGWVEERKWHFPEIYRGGFNNKLYFLNAGNIYEEQVDFSLPGLPYGEE